MSLENVDVWVIDSSSLVKTKELLTAPNQWDTFKLLEEMVEAGEIAMHRLVIRELSEIAHPDMPGAWAPGMRSKLVHPLDASDDKITHVMAVAGDVVDPTKTKEDADPWVLALALDLQEEVAVCVVSDDVVDRNRISIRTACDRLDLEQITMREFLTHLGVPVRKPKEHGDSDGVEPDDI